MDPHPGRYVERARKDEARQKDSNRAIAVLVPEPSVSSMSRVGNVIVMRTACQVPVDRRSRRAADSTSRAQAPGRRSMSALDLPGAPAKGPPAPEGHPPRGSRRCDITVYVYRCPQHGPIETSVAMGSAPAVVVCLACGAVSARVFTAPRLSLGSPTRRALIERTERTSEQPDVVPAPPPVPDTRRRADVTRNPALSRLPRP